MKHKLSILFGESACVNLEAKTVECAKFTTNHCGGEFVEYEFETEAEKSAYIQGVKDCLGWGEFCVIGESVVDKIDRLASKCEDPQVAAVVVQFTDDLLPCHVNICLYDCTPDGYDDEDIFFYCSGIEDLKSLCEESPGADFVVIDIESIN